MLQEEFEKVNSQNAAYPRPWLQSKNLDKTLGIDVVRAMRESFTLRGLASSTARTACLLAAGYFVFLIGMSIETANVSGVLVVWLLTYLFVAGMTASYASRPAAIVKAKGRRFPLSLTSIGASLIAPLPFLACGVFNAYMASMHLERYIPWVPLLILGLGCYAYLSMIPVLVEAENIPIPKAMVRLSRLLRGRGRNAVILLSASTLVWAVGLLLFIIPGVVLGEWHARNQAALYVYLTSEQP